MDPLWILDFEDKMVEKKTGYKNENCDRLHKSNTTERLTERLTKSNIIILMGNCFVHPNGDGFISRNEVSAGHCQTTSCSEIN